MDHQRSKIQIKDIIYCEALITPFKRFGIEQKHIAVRRPSQIATFHSMHPVAPELFWYLEHDDGSVGVYLTDEMDLINPIVAAIIEAMYADIPND